MSVPVYQDKSDFLRKLNENYSDIREINSGGGGVIYSGIHTRLGQKVVLKKIKGASLELVGKTREIEILQSLKHTYLPRIVDFWSYNDEVYTVMEFIEGRSLKECIDEGRRFSEREVIKLTRQLAEVLTYLHESSLHIVHSDIKPANIMLTPNGDICLIDFNISVLAGGEADDTIGYTPGYAPPEQLIGFELGRRKRRERRAAQAQFVQSQPVQIDDATELMDDDATELMDDATVLEENDATVLEPTPVVTAPAYQPPSQQIKPTPVKTSKGSKKQALTISEQADLLIKRYGKKLKVDARSDIYSACATMYQLLTGHPPKPCYLPQVPIMRYLPNANDAFARIIEKGMESDPSKRHKSSAVMLKALTNIARSTKKYKRMRLAQDIVVILLVTVIAAGGVSAYLGLKLTAANKAQSTVQTASELYLAGDYQGAVDALNALIAKPLGAEDATLSEAYYVLGSTYLQVGDNVRACDSYRNALLYGMATSELYRDYGIALVGTGNIGKASECLSQARALGLSDDSLLLLSGEISIAKGELDTAISEFQACLSSESSAPMVIVRAARALDAIDASLEETDENYVNRINRLDHTLSRLEDAGILRLPLLELKAQVAMDATIWSDGRLDFTNDAIMAFDEIIDGGFASHTDYLSKAACLQNVKRYDEALEVLTEAASKYPTSYEVYKYLAFLEVERQYARDIDSRDYTDFGKYYEQCISLYAKEPHAEQDLEIDVLKKAFKDAVDKGWLSE